MIRFRDLRAPKDADDVRMFERHAGDMLTRCFRPGLGARDRFACFVAATAYARRAARRSG